PGIIFYLTRWFPARERARAIATFMTANFVAGMVGGPLSGALLSLDGVARLPGWQWLFLVEGLPAVFLGVVVLRVPPETPQDASWLMPRERAALVAALADDAATTDAAADARMPFRNGRVWRMAAVYFTI